MMAFFYFGPEVGSAGRNLNQPLLFFFLQPPGNRKRSETGIKNLNHLLQKARFTFQALLVDRLTPNMISGKVMPCIVAVAHLVSLWRDTCNYTGTQDFSIFIDPGREVMVFTFDW